jgi:hypothetical protein
MDEDCTRSEGIGLTTAERLREGERTGSNNLMHYDNAYVRALQSTYTPSRGCTPMNTPPICSPTTANEPEVPAVPGVVEGER